MELLTPKIYTREGRRIEFDGSLRVLNLGCGEQRYPHVVGVDVVKTSAADIIHDLDKAPWPIADNSVDVILAFHLFEHVEDLPRFMEEVHRIAKPNARIIVEVPYFRSVLAYQDPTHRRFFTTRTLDYFCPEKGLGRYGYSKARFTLAEFWLGWPAKSSNPLKQRMKDFFKKHQDIYDAYLSRLYAMDILVFELVVVK